MVVLVAGGAWRGCEAADAGHGAVPGRRRPHVFQLHMWRVTLRAAFGDGLRRRVWMSVLCVPVFNAHAAALTLSVCRNPGCTTPHVPWRRSRGSRHE